MYEYITTDKLVSFRFPHAHRGANNPMPSRLSTSLRFAFGAMSSSALFIANPFVMRIFLDLPKTIQANALVLIELEKVEAAMKTALTNRNLTNAARIFRGEHRKIGGFKLDDPEVYLPAIASPAEFLQVAVHFAS